MVFDQKPDLVSHPEKHIEEIIVRSRSDKKKMAFDQPQGLSHESRDMLPKATSDWSVSQRRKYLHFGQFCQNIHILTTRASSGLWKMHSTQNKRAYVQKGFLIGKKQETDPINPIDHGRIKQHDSKMCISLRQNTKED